MVTRRIFAAAWLVAAALLLLLVPCTRSGHAGWFLVWQTGSVEIVLNQIRSENFSLLWQVRPPAPRFQRCIFWLNA